MRRKRETSLKKVIFHIGSHKTGTSSIQVALCKNRQQLEAMRIHLPPAKSRLFVESSKWQYIADQLRSQGNFSDLAMALRGVADIDTVKQYLHEMKQDLEIADESTLIVSGEELARLNQTELLSFKELFEDTNHEFHLIYFVRHQSECLVGLYQTLLTSQFYENKFEVFMDEYIHHFDFYNIARLWSQTFKLKTISVEQYINPTTGEPIDSVRIFSDLISKICDSEIDLPSTTANKGIGGDTIRLLEHLSAVNDQHLIQGIRALSNLIPNELQQIEFLSRPRFEYINDQYRESNVELQKTYGIYPMSLIQIKKIQLENGLPSMEETIKNVLVSIAQKLPISIG
jgi:hypothetical protein